MAGRSRAAGRRTVGGGRAQHFLASTRLAAALVDRAGVMARDRVVELGAGTGVLTAPLADRAGLVMAIELDAALVARLKSRLAGAGNVLVLHGDALETPLPANPYRVIANLPFSRTTAILHRLLDDPSGSLVRADVIVQWQVARARAKSDFAPPTDLLAVIWGPWWRFRRGRRLPASSFRPPPSVDAAVLVAIRRTPPLVAVEDHTRYATFVRRGFQQSRLDRILGDLLSKVGVRALRRDLELDDGQEEARDLSVEQWARLFSAYRRQVTRSGAR
ncbi:MAG: ribosomal RNA small subunit methyltransferase A [Acidimicrobiia bacterium]